MICRVAEYRQVMIDGRQYQDGDMVDVSDEMAKALRAAGVLDPPEPVERQTEKQERRR